MPVESDFHFDEAIAAVERGASRGLEQAAEREKQNSESQYDQGADALGRPWTPLAPATIAQTGPRILVDTGDMRNSFYVRRTGPLSVVFGNQSSLIHYHEYGTKDIPRRPVMTPAKTHLEAGLLRSEVAKEIAKSIAALKSRARV